MRCSSIRGKCSELTTVHPQHLVQQKRIGRLLQLFFYRICFNKHAENAGRAVTLAMTLQTFRTYTMCESANMTIVSDPFLFISLSKKLSKNRQITTLGTWEKVSLWPNVYCYFLSIKRQLGRRRRGESIFESLGQSFFVVALGRSAADERFGRFFSGSSGSRSGPRGRRSCSRCRSCCS